MKVSKLKVSNSRKTRTTELARKGDPFAFLTSIVAKHQKLKGDPLVKFLFRKNVSQCRKKLTGGHVTRKKGENLFGSVR